MLNEQFWGLAKKAASIAGEPIKPEWIYSQWAHETGNFTSTLGKEYHNLGGLTQTTPNNTPQPDGSCYYMQFSSYEDYANYFGKYLKYYREDGIYDSKNIEDYVKALKHGGYFGDSLENYLKSVKSIETDNFQSNNATVANTSSQTAAANENSNSNVSPEAAWRARYDDIMQEIANSDSMDKRKQKADQYKDELYKMKVSGLPVNNDLAYLGIEAKANRLQNSQTTENVSSNTNVSPEAAWRARYDNILDDIANSNSVEEKTQKVNDYNNQLSAMRDSKLPVDDDLGKLGITLKQNTATATNANIKQNLEALRSVAYASNSEALSLQQEPNRASTTRSENGITAGQSKDAGSQITVKELRTMAQDKIGVIDEQICNLYAREKQLRIQTPLTPQQAEKAECTQEKQKLNSEMQKYVDDVEKYNRFKPGWFDLKDQKLKEIEYQRLETLYQNLSKRDGEIGTKLEQAEQKLNTPEALQAIQKRDQQEAERMGKLGEVKRELQSLSAERQEPCAILSKMGRLKDLNQMITLEGDRQDPNIFTKNNAGIKQQVEALTEIQAATLKIGRGR